jgi:hypothetical protein
MNLHKRWLGIASLAVMLPLSAQADLPGQHPYYLHALSDLRAAYWLIDHRPGDAAVSGQEDIALSEISRAHSDMKAAAIDDGKDIHDHPPVDLPNDHSGRLHRGLEVLRKVRNDVNHEEDDPQTKGLKEGTLVHLDRAIHATEHAIQDVEQHR